jgi:hypothetical protein
MSVRLRLKVDPVSLSVHYLAVSFAENTRLVRERWIVVARDHRGSTSTYVVREPATQGTVVMVMNIDGDRHVVRYPP